MRPGPALSTMRGEYTRSYQKPARPAIHSRLVFLKKALLQVDREHAPAGATPEGGVLDAVVEDHEIARLGFEDKGGDIGAWDTPVLLGTVGARRSDRLVHAFGVGITHLLTSRDDAETTAVAPHRVEIEGQLDRTVAWSTLIAVRVPGSVADEVVAVARHVVEVLSQQSGANALDTLVVK